MIVGMDTEVVERRTGNRLNVSGAVARAQTAGVSPGLRPGGGALAFEQLQDALRVLPDRADVAEHQLGPLAYEMSRDIRAPGALALLAGQGTKSAAVMPAA